MPAASLSSSTPSTTAVGRPCSDLRKRLDERRRRIGVVRAVEHRQRLAVQTAAGAREPRWRRPRHARPARGGRGRAAGIRAELAAIKDSAAAARARSCAAGTTLCAAAAGRDSRRCTPTIRAARSRATRSPPRSASVARSRPSTSVAPGSSTASFSSAMSFSVGPSQRVCSRPTFVSTVTRESITFVASYRPPSPASTTATSTPCSAISQRRPPSAVRTGSRGRPQPGCG